MLQIQHICKEYHTGKLVQHALDDFSLNLRDNEFVAVLGPSGSGKTTLLNIIGGLDQYDSGDLIINGVSTRKYKDRDWDSYRNHTIGFVFQSYNLIPHQTLLSNVELALTISGVGKKERRRRAREALERVGLGDQVDKRPNQLSGGQMQRVAIARALVNDPDILLADEPTGALDSATSLQVMDLLKEVAKDKLVVMVTHNPELAEQYATRIVNIRDGRMVSDSDPYEIDDESLPELSYGNMGKAFMSLPTSISLSFNNLLTKKARTLLTAFAGSIGIIGIALILSLSTGVNDYIAEIEEETLSGYPLTISNSGFDMTSLMAGSGIISIGDDGELAEDEISVVSLITSMLSTVEANDLAALKEYLDGGESGVEPYINSIEYTYNVAPQIYLEYENGDYRQVNPDSSFSALGFGASASSSSMISSMMSTDVFHELPTDEGMYIDQYELKAGRWPESYNEIVLVLTSGGSVSDLMLYSMGLRDSAELDDMVQQFIEEEDIDAPDDIGTYGYDEILGLTFNLVNASDYYEYDEQYEVWKDKTDNKEYMKDLVSDGEELTIVGIVQPVPEATISMLSSGLYYSPSLVEHIVETASESEIVKNQLDNPNVNVFTGEPFGAEEEEENSFDMSSLFEIDEDALAEAFSFDEDELNEAMEDSLDFSDSMSLSMGSFSLGSMDLSSYLNLGGLSGISGGSSLDMSTMLDGITIDLSSIDLSDLFNDFMEGYMKYSGNSSMTDLTNIGSSFMDYLQSDSAQQILIKSISDIYGNGGNVTVSMDKIGELGETLFSLYMVYIAGGNDATDYRGFLNLPEAQAAIQSWISNNITVDSNVSVTSAQMESLASDLMAGYQIYAIGNSSSTDMNQISQSFTDYLGTKEASKLISSAITEVIDTEALETQLGTVMESYMNDMVNSYGSALSGSLSSQISSATSGVISQMSSQISAQMSEMMSEMMNEFVDLLSDNMTDAMEIDEETFADAFTFNMEGDDLTELLITLSTASSDTYAGNLSNFGYVDFDSPDEIAIYPIDFAGKDVVVDILDAYNEQMEEQGEEDKIITYSDTVGALMSSVTDIVDMISYVLIAFVAISLVVSSIMIGVITYISVLERQKEIGILRAIGASKGNISQVFNAETGIVGLFAGLLGVGIAYLLTIPGDAIIRYFAGDDRVKMVLMPQYAAALVILSIALTLIGGLIPSSTAARSDPVKALRTE